MFFIVFNAESGVTEILSICSLIKKLCNSTGLSVMPWSECAKCDSLGEIEVNKYTLANNT